MRLIKFPGEPARPPFAHSWFVLAAVLAETEVVERASRVAETVGCPSYGDGPWGMGLISGEYTEGDDASDGGLFEGLLFLLIR